MSWPIWIGITTAGELLIGARDVHQAEAAGELAESERVWPSQLGHRCAVYMPKVEMFEDPRPWRLMSPRKAKTLGTAVKRLKLFPKATAEKSSRPRRRSGDAEA